MRVKDLKARTHDDFCPELLGNIHALYEGGEDWNERKHIWLPQSQIEPLDLYNERLARALYTEPQYPVIVNLTLGALFAEPLKVDGLDKAAWDRLSKDADGATTSFSDFMRQELCDAINYRFAYVWVDLPAQTEPATSAAEEKSRINKNLILRRIDPRCVQNWMERSGALTGVLLAEEVEEIEGDDVVAKPVRVWRWTAVDAKLIRRWEWRETETQHEPTDDDPVTELPPIAHNYGAMPIVRLKLARDHWLGARLHDPAIALIRAECDRDWTLYRASNELLVIASRHPVDRVKSGPGYYLQVTRDDKGSDTAQYVGPTGVALSECAKRSEDARTSLFRVAQHLQLAADPSAASARQSAESKARDWEVTAILLESYGDAILDFVREVCKLIATLTSTDPDAIEVTGIRGESKDPAVFLKDAAAAIDLKMASPTAMTEICKRMARLLLGDDIDDDTMAKITDEVETYFADMANGTGAGVLPIGGAGGTTAGGPGSGRAGRPGAGGASGRGQGGGRTPA